MLNSHIAKNEKTQKVGCVLLISTLDDYPLNMDYEYLRLQLQLISCTPIRLVAIYVLAVSPSSSASTSPSTSTVGGGIGGGASTDSSGGSSSSKTNLVGWNNAIDFATYIMGKTLRLRMRCIRGTPMECRYQLMCLGFTSNNLPKELLEEEDESDNDDEEEDNTDSDDQKKEGGSNAADDEMNKTNKKRKVARVLGNGHQQHGPQGTAVVLDDDEPAKAT